MAKQPAPKKMTLKKQAKPRKVLVHPYRVRFGTRNQLGPERQFATETAARTAIITELNSFRGWCERHNHEGLDALDEAKNKVGSITFNSRPNRLECVFDELYGLHIVAEYWSSRP